MFTLVVFIIALVLITLLFVMKSLELSRGRKFFLEKQFDDFDAWIHRVLLRLKSWYKQITFKNIGLFFSWLVDNIKSLIIAIKRRFDHKQSSFFTKRDLDSAKNKGSVSFFLKDVSDYKKSLREGKEDIRG